MIRSLGPSRLALLRPAHTRILVSSRAFVAPTVVLRADLVQELYLKELKAHKPTPVKPSDSDEHVLKFSAPKPPRSPEEGDIANDLKAYEGQQVEVEGQAAAGEAAPADEDWFEEDDDEEAAPPAH